MGPVDDDLHRRIAESFDRQGLMRHLAARLTRVEPGRVHIELANRREVTQQHGYVHAGATSAIADSAGGYAALTLLPADADVLTVTVSRAGGSCPGGAGPR
ncbi:hypothetical protein Vau01_039780 [Virgisporangium aurantiacum]|uniref:DUF4442 domain-containing protein n=1 Tax=Virgisporangium aurantiacum TaxID=175570 RepID=A0A8J3Z480_9ACTN|nr:hypothetical protein Vau01_039780 [Virgisporangium aurantiacum]